MQISNWLNTIKTRIGASYVSYERVGNNYNLKVIKKGEVEHFPLTGTPTDVTPEKYTLLLNQLQEYYGTL